MSTKHSQITRTIQPVTVKKLVDDYLYRIDLEADYQREKIWSPAAQEKLLNSILQGIDIPKIYLARVKDDESFDFECVDGKQRMATLMNFFHPERGERPVTVDVFGKKYSYKELMKQHPELARDIEEFELTLVIYPATLEDEFIREIFRRLQLGVSLNSGERLNSHTGTIRDFIYKEMGKEAPFLRNTRLSERRYSRQFALAQICINSFSLAKTGEFVRARFGDLEDFFKDNHDLDGQDKNLVRIRRVLGLMDRRLRQSASAVSSRAVAVSAYLFVERLFKQKRRERIAEFGEFYAKLLEEVKANLKLLSAFEKPRNRTVLEEFQRHVSQASVEPFAIRGRHRFLEKAFHYYRARGGRIIGSR
jgi:Protein of unknown function DUF262